MADCITKIRPYNRYDSLSELLGRPFIYSRGGVEHYEIVNRIWTTGNTGMINDYTFENLAQYGYWLDTNEPMGEVE